MDDKEKEMRNEMINADKTPYEGGRIREKNIVCGNQTGPRLW